MSAPSSGERRTPEPDQPVPYRGAVAALLHSAAVPYGYTLTVWGSTALVASRSSRPRVADVFLFVAGATVAFAAMGVLSRGRHSSVPSPKGPDMLVTGVSQLVAVGASVAVALALSAMHSAIVWPGAGFAVTAVFFSVASAGLAVTMRTRQRRESGELAPSLRSSRRR